MAYYFRIFCKSSIGPPLRKISGWIHNSGGTLSPSPYNESANLDSAEWNQIEFHYRDAASWVLVELDKDTGTDDCLFRQEVREFVDDRLASVAESPQKSKVIAHLRSSKYAVAISVPTGRFEDQDYRKLGNFISDFAMFCDGMIQADGEGFYEGGTLIVELP
jgi:hypothetical protein